MTGLTDSSGPRFGIVFHHYKVGKLNISNANTNVIDKSLLLSCIISRVRFADGQVFSKRYRNRGSMENNIFCSVYRY